MFLSRSTHGIYYLFYLDGLGVRRKVSTRCRRKSEALEFLRTFTHNEQERKVRQQRTLFSKFAMDFLAYSQSVHTRSTQRHFVVAFREFLRTEGDIPLHKIGVREIEHFLATKKLGASEWTSRKYYGALASALETARRWGLVGTNPFRSVDKPKAREVVPLFFTKEDFRKLLGAVDNADLRDLYLCAVCTGLRLGELRSLRWVDIDFERNILSTRNSEIFTTKNRRNRTIPLNEGLRTILLERRDRSPSTFVFEYCGRQMKQDHITEAFKRCVLKAGLNPRLHFHSLRHTFATWLVQAGVSLYEVQKLLGHSSISTTQIYAHLAASELHGAVNRISLDWTHKPLELR